ncbi:DNA-binding transcription factor [Lithospermum erythrorhizon]|uniref:DNA-binding transcription factor n=1 Tax=Lithospermum erythrorhizon TaxID=34254 RepID=A0AAV3S0T5_LITER
MGENNNNNNFNLPPGFRFYPTDEELVVHFLHRKATLLPCHPDVIPDLELNPYDPWDLDGKAMGEGNKWYYYSRMTQSRVTENGYWNPLGIDEPIFSNSGQKVGMKKLYVFFVGESPEEGTKTNWIMEEFRLSDSASSSSNSRTRRRSSKPDYSKWVVCRVYECDDDNDEGDSTELSCLDEVFLSLEDLDETSFPN